MLYSGKYLLTGATVFGWMAEELCGTSAPDQINGTKQDMYLRMVTNDNELTLGTGFNLQYRIYELGEYFTPLCNNLI